MENYIRFYKVAGITLQINSDLPILENTFHPKFKLFEVDGPSDDNIIINHHFERKRELNEKISKIVYNKIPWKIYKSGKTWIYQRIHPYDGALKTYCTAFFNESHTSADIYHSSITKTFFRKGGNENLTFLQTDQVLLARVLADRNGCFFHSNGVLFEDCGFLFLGHSGYGKSTIAKMLKKNGGKILCDDRMIVRQWSKEIMMYGNWCHGKEGEFSADVIPLKAFFFISKSNHNEIIQIDDNKQNIFQLLSFIVKPFVTQDWWKNNLSLIEKLITIVPCYNLMFDKSGKIVKIIRDLC